LELIENTGARGAYRKKTRRCCQHPKYASKCVVSGAPILIGDEITQVSINGSKKAYGHFACSQAKPKADSQQVEPVEELK
jgi:hypothetical protein